MIEYTCNYSGMSSYKAQSTKGAEAQRKTEPIEHIYFVPLVPEQLRIIKKGGSCGKVYRGSPL